MIGETLSQQDWEKRYGATPTPVSDSSTPETIPQEPSRWTGTGFGERLRLSFGGEQAEQQRAQIEQQKGLDNRFDIGDIADIGGSIPTAVGSVLGGLGGTFAGGPVGTAAGAGIGAAAGEATKQTIGHALGVRGDTTPMGEFARPLVAGATTALTTKGIDLVLQPVARFAQNWLPEKFYGQVFKQEYDDFIKQIKPEALLDLQKTDPGTFNSLVEKGIVKLGKTGEIVVNPTLAREAFDRGLKGSPEYMLKQLYQNQLKLESQVKELISPEQMIKVENKTGYMQALQEIKDFFSKNSYGTNPERISNATSLLESLSQSPKDEIPADIALALRRYLDGMRNTKSFLSDVSLTPKQEGLKALTNSLRHDLAEQVPGLREIMNEYRFSIEAFDSLAEKAVKMKNAKLLNLTDMIVGGGGLAGGFPGTGIGAATAIRGFQQPFSLTHLGQFSKSIGSGIQNAIPTMGYAGSQAIQEGGRRLFDNYTQTQ